MEKPRLIIAPKKYTGETAVISMRIPKDMVGDLDRIAETTGRTRNEIVSMCLEFAMMHMEIIEKDSSTNQTDKNE